MQTEILKLQGMNDDSCAKKIARVLEAIDGVGDVRVSLAETRAIVQLDERVASLRQLQKALEHAGYPIETTSSPAPSRTGCCGGCGG